MRRHPASFIIILLAALLTACAPQFAPTSTPAHSNVVPTVEAAPTHEATPTTEAVADPITIVTLYYEAINTNQIDQAAAFMADDIEISDPSGGFSGKDRAITYWQGLATGGFTFELSELKANEGRVTSCYKVYQSGGLRDQGCNGVQLVQDGKIIFDGLADAEAIYVVKHYYDALNAKDLDLAMSYIDGKAVFINPTGSYEGKEVIRESLEGLIADNITFELSKLNELNGSGRVFYNYKVLQNGGLLEEGEDGLTTVKDGKIVFDGTEATEP